MYRDNYAVAVMIDGKVQKEDNTGTAVLPFETEYQIRLKNKNRKKAVADVYIDGRMAAKGIVIDACGTVDLERFVADGNLSSGNRFKIVKANDGRVEQPGESENGLVHVNFYPEKDKPEVKVVVHETVHRHPHCHHDCCPGTCFWCSPRYSNIFYTSGAGPVYGSSMSSGNIQSKGMNAGNPDVTLNASLTSSGGGSGTVSSVNISDNAISEEKIARSFVNQVAEAAATVEGSLSHQKFTHVSIDVDYDKCTTLQIKLKGVKSAIITCECGYKRKQEKFCPQCGTKLVIEVAA